MTTQADNATALGMPPDGVEATAPAPCPLTHDYVLATNLRPGDQIRDRGALHTIDEVHHPARAGYCVTIVMEDRRSLGIAPQQPVSVWRPAAARV